MANKNLKYFMREESRQEQIFQVPAPARFVDEKGEVIREKTEVGKRERDGVFRLIGHFGEIRLTGWNIYCMIYT